MMAEDKKEKEKHRGIHGFKLGNFFKRKEEDSAFATYKENFKKQRAVAQQYNNVFQKYDKCLNDMVECQERLHNIVEQTYEGDWIASYELKEYLKGASSEWANYKTSFAKLLDDQRAYLAKFEDLKKKISDRRKKRDEFETAKKDLDAKQQSKKPDTGKIATAELEFKSRKSEFEKIDAELSTELPEFFDSRITFYQSNIGCLAKSDQQLFGELMVYLDRATNKFEGSTNSELKQKSFTKLPSDPGTNPFNVSTDTPASKTATPSGPTGLYPQLPKVESTKDSPTPRHRISLANSTQQTASDIRKSAAPTPPLNNSSVNTTPVIPAKPPRITKLEPPEPSKIEDSPGNPFLSEESETEESGSPAQPKDETEQVDEADEKSENNEKAQLSVTGSDVSSKRESVETVEAVAPERSPKASQSPSRAEELEEPEKCLRKVKATHKYEAIEDDELAFDKGVIIEVLAWISDEDAEEGWLRGRLNKDGKCGVFPENHTKPVE